METAFSLSSLNPLKWFSKPEEHPALQLKKEELNSNHAELALQLIEALNNCHGRADFTQNPTVKELINTLYEQYPHAFGHGNRYVFESQEDINTLITNLKGTLGIPSDLPTPQLTNLTPITTENTSHNALIEDISSSNAAVESIESNGNNRENTGYKDYNLGLAFVQMQAKLFEFQEERIRKLLVQFDQLNKTIKDISSLMNAFTKRANKNNANFSDDTEMRAVIDRLHAVDSRVFGKVLYEWKGEAEIDAQLSALDMLLKSKNSELNQVVMFINLYFDERIKGTEAAQKGLETDNRLKSAIISKTGSKS